MGNTQETPSSELVSTKLKRIAELAKKMPGVALKTLSHHIDIELMREAYRRTRKDGASGIDGVTAREYEAELEANLTDLLNRFKSGTYWAPPVRRSYIPKADGGRRALGIPTFEDKVLQTAVSMVLGAVYEQDFLSASYGYRPNTGALQALRDLREELMQMKGGWVLEGDIQSFFDMLNHGHLRSFLDQRVLDGVLRKAIDKWLKAGVMEGDVIQYPTSGSPQGGVISPLLANIYLHEVLDVWFEQQVRPRMRGRVRLIRYADDFVICAEREDDAKRIMEVLPKRFAKYGLTLHPDKTRLLEYERPSRSGDDDDPPTFNFLGFSHYWSRTRRGSWVIKRRTEGKRMSRKLHEVWQWCRQHRHEPVEWQWNRLRSRLTGYYNYFGIPCNYASIYRYFVGVRKSWRYWLNRRSQRKSMPWARFDLLEQRYPLPEPRIVHSWV